MLKRFFLFICAAAVLCSGCTLSEPEDPRYTLRIVLPNAPQNLSPHGCASDEEQWLSSLLGGGFVRRGCAEDDEWTYEMATAIEDITKDWDDKDAWGITETQGRVFRIALNSQAAWEDGTPITADSYLASMELLLDPAYHSRAASYWTDSPAALLNSAQYRAAGTTRYEPLVPYYESVEKAEYPDTPEDRELYLHLTSHDMTLSQNYSVEELMKMGYVRESLYRSLERQADPAGYIAITEDNSEEVHALAQDVLAFFGVLYNEDSFAEMLFCSSGEKWPELDYSQVGLMKEDDFSLLYITESELPLEQFCSYMTKSWLVDCDLYQKDPSAYGSAAQHIRSYGPYRVESMEKDGTVTFVRSENWFGYAETKETSSPMPERIRCLAASEREAVSLLERGKADLCVFFSDCGSDISPEIQKIRCETCGGTLLLSPRLSAEGDSCLVRMRSVCLFSIQFSDSMWEEYCRNRGGYAVLPKAE